MLDSFGAVAAEDDAVLDYFVETEIAKKVARGGTMLVLGRKGAGKTALVRAFTERPDPDVFSRPLQFRAYPWGMHGTRVDKGASEIEAFVASWEFFLAVETASMVFQKCENKSRAPLKKIGKFLKDNYGTTDTQEASILGPDTLRLEGSFEPSVLGFKIGKLDLKRAPNEATLGRDLAALSGAIFAAVEEAAAGQLDDKTLLLHLDELDQGLSTLDEKRSRMLIGLVLAARAVKKRFEKSTPKICPVVYLRTDIWDELRFSDKNKVVESASMTIEWTSDKLRQMIERRASVKLGRKIAWTDLEDGEPMRAAQSKWDYVIDRTYLRPRDAIKFCNVVLSKSAGKRFTNRDVLDARTEYSSYLKAELDDEIVPHWPDWTKALDAISSLQKSVFTTEEFAKAYGTGAAEALEMLYQFSVIGYRGASWTFRYENPAARWDRGATSCKLHAGLREYARVKD